ncbi:MoaD/ThiS family protein [Cnuibacter sp. UC19_7]|uniref:MoaD/ThiS family protein n=1 Tax=Cnuibacter sp. UC19_7 TaxID=3350166 RepID=UPI00366D09E2
MSVVTIRYFAAAKAAVGRVGDELDAAGRSIADVLGEIAAGATGTSSSEAGAVLSRCSFLLNRSATTDRTRVLADGDTLDVLPPFAGG